MRSPSSLSSAFFVLLIWCRCQALVQEKVALLRPEIAANEALRNLRHYSELLFMTDGLVVHWMFELACPKLGKH